MFARKAASGSSSDEEEEEEGATTGYESEWKGFSTATGADDSDFDSDSDSSSTSSSPRKPKRPVPVVSSDSDEESESEPEVESPAKRAPTHYYESPQKRRRLSLEREERVESLQPGLGASNTAPLFSQPERSSRLPGQGSYGSDSGASGTDVVKYSPGWPRTVSSAAASESGRSQRSGPGNATADEWDWGSVEAASEDDENRGAVDAEEMGEDWGSVEAASDDEEEVGDNAGPGIDDVVDWGSVEAASDDEDNAPGERIDDENGARVTLDSSGEIPGDGGYEAEAEDEGEDIVPPNISPVEPESEFESESEFEDEPEDENAVPPHPPSDGSRTTQLVSKLPTPETSEHDSVTDYAAKSRFIHSASRQFKESTLPKERPPKVRGRRRGEQINKFTSGYVDLLNDDIHQATGRKVYSDSSKLPVKSGSFVMGSYWTVKDKEVFFNHLAVLGKDRVDAIAKAVGTKSVLECQSYIDALHEGRLGSQNSVGSRSRDTIGLGEIPAAVELSGECIKALDQQAAFVADRQRRDEEKTEKRRWGVDFWLLDSEWASRIDGFYNSGNIDSILDVAPEAELLNVPKVLELSERIFMNRPGKQNYRRITERDEKPSIRYTALVDLHDLVMAITRRLVQTAIWMSESRQRVLELPMFSSKPIVRLDDAQAAVDALNMPINSFDYWVKAPRRVGVKVLEYTTDPEPMSLDKVEEKLSHVPVRYMRRFKWDRSQFSGISAECNTSSQNKGEETEDEKGGEEETEEEETEEWKTGVREKAEGEKAEGEKAEEGETDEDSQEVSDTEISLINDDSQDDLSGPVSTHSKIGVAERRHDERQRTMEAEEDKYLERLDRKHAIKAEKELWRIMGFGELEHAEEEDGALSEDSEDPKAPRREGRRERRIPNWRSDVRYRAPWEQELEKRQREDGDADNNVGDALSHNMQAAMESITKRRKIANAPGKAVKLNTEAKRKSVAGKVKQEQKRKQTQEQPLPRSPRKQRNRRQSTAVPGFVSTVDAVSDVEAVVAEGVDDEDDEDEDLYQEEE